MRQPDAAERHLIRSDPALAAVIRFVRSESPRTPELFQEDRRPPFEFLVNAIVGQQLSSAAARTIYGRVVTVLRDEVTPERILATKPETLRGAGLSNSKVRFTQSVALAAQQGHFDLRAMARMSDSAVVEHLCAVKGIGPWTAQMFLMFRLRRPDVLPLGDGGILRTLKVVYGVRRPTASRLMRVAKAWRPHATLACLFLWTALDLGLARRQAAQPGSTATVARRRPSR